MALRFHRLRGIQDEKRQTMATKLSRHKTNSGVKCAIWTHGCTPGVGDRMRVRHNRQSRQRRDKNVKSLPLFKG